MSKFHIFSETLILGPKVFIWFEHESQYKNYQKPDAIIVGYGNDKILKLSDIHELRHLMAHANLITSMWQVMGNWLPWVGDTVEVLRGEPDLHNMKHRGYSSYHKVGLVTRIENTEIHVRLDHNEQI